jgi:hypothetical protein
MSSLVEKIRQSRRVEIPVGKIKFFGRRPSVAEFYQMFVDRTQDVEVVKKFIDGWEGVRGNDLFDGAGTEIIPFDQDFFNEAIVDKPEIWKPIVEKLIEVTKAHIKADEDNEKNLQGGSSKAK